MAPTYSKLIFLYSCYKEDQNSDLLTLLTEDEDSIHSLGLATVTVRAASRRLLGVLTRPRSAQAQRAEWTFWSLSAGCKLTKLYLILCWNKKTLWMVENKVERKFVQKKPEKMMSR
ncbi:zinc finger protein OZF isoform X3 [Canis lupus familiaris]|uniref:zinc finger protein OZF isoform X3 n=1 Tax=Canis lupus familiaris TaxID=9615 RepID=UPI0018F7621E|nr:zinc finger protein OZF isoform X3 [Canis lupus familiaris]